MGRVLWLGGWAASRNYLNVSFGVDELRFATTYWYDDVDFEALRARDGDAALERLVLHVAAFEANKLCSLRPTEFDLGPLAAHCTPAFEELWTTVAHRVWAEWRYRHDAPGLRPPTIRCPRAIRLAGPVSAPRGRLPTLALCGGGKDSLVMMRLLEAAGEPYATAAYAHSVYGRLDVQHELISALVGECAGGRAHRLWMIDDALGSPVVQLRPEFEARSLTAAETPASLFAMLPLALAHGYRRILVGHERSADTGNLVWEATGEEINHQWGKSLEAERLLGDYVRDHLVDNIDYASPLKPLTDTVIFSMLDPDDPALPHAHSCNERKPWCGRCAKCAYVWLGYMAHLPVETVDAIFDGRNLFDDEANQLWFRQLVGMEAHTPFECVGGIDEARLFFDRCARRGLTGRALDDYRAAGLELPTPQRMAQLCEAGLENHTLPEDLHARLAPLLRAAAASAVATGEIRAWSAPRRSATAARPRA
jgi:hypothetical protein